MSSSKHSSALHKAPSFDLYSQAAHHSGSGPPLHSSGGYAPNSRSGSDNSSGAFLQRQTSPSNDRSEKAQSPSSSQSSHLANLSPLSRSLWTNVKKSSSGPLMVSANDPTAWLTWKEVTVSVSLGGTDTHCILDNLSGYAEPGHLMAIMGPSGSGKSTLLDALAGRLAKNTTMSGEVRVNGRRRKLSYGSVAFVTQEDTLLGTLTVRETIFYSAHLRLPDSMPWHEKESIVEGTILEMGLQDCADTPVGNWHLRGLSGGEKRRVSIALEILMRPRLLFLDEPTSGLDSASAFFVMQTLRGLSRDGRTVLFSIHQPSSEVFALFDKLYLLSGGRTIYFGDAARSHEFFAQAGFPCPQRRNPSDHFLRCVNSDFERVKDSLKSSTRQRRNGAIDPLDKHTTAEVIDILTDAYNNSGQAVATAVKVYSISQIKGLVLESSGSQASFLMQAKTLTKRSFVNMTRDLGYYWLRLFIYIFVAICVGTMYFKVGTSYSSILARGACTSYVAGFVTFMSIGGFPSFIEDMKVFQRERLNGHYGVLAFVVANTLSSLPYLLAIALATGTICYYMAGLHPGFDHYLFFAINLLGCIAVVESLMMAIASVVSNFLLGIITGAGLLGVFMLVAGFFRLPDDLPKIFWRYPMSYLSFNYWALQGQYKNDYWGLLFDNISPLLPPITGEEVLRDKFQISLSWSKWWDTAMVYVFMIVYRLIFFLNIKLSENVTPYVRAFLNKRTSQWKAQRLSSKTVIPVNKQSPDARHQ